MKSSSVLVIGDINSTASRVVIHADRADQRQKKHGNINFASFGGPVSGSAKRGELSYLMQTGFSLVYSRKLFVVIVL